MNNNFSLKFKKFDIIAIVTSIIIAISIMITIFATGLINSSNTKYVNIYHQGIKLEEYTVNLSTLSKTITIVLEKDKFPKLLDDFTIEVDPKKGVRVKDVTCYDNTCIKQGWVNIINLPIICIPNDVRIEINNNSNDLSGEILGGCIHEFH